MNIQEEFFMTNRSVATVVILTIVTCGIYGLYWLYVTADGLENYGRTGSVSPVVQLILAIFVSVAGYVLFGIAANENLNSIRAQKGLPPVDNKVAYILLGLFIPIVLIGLVQSEINKLTQYN